MSRAIEHSLGALAAEFGMTRDVLRRVVSEAGVSPTGKRGGHPIYRLRDVFVAITKQSDGEHMNPHARFALARAIKTEDEIKTARRELVASHDVEQEVGRIFKIVVQGFETAADNLERDVGLSAKQAARLEKHFDEYRERLYRAVVGDNGE